MALLQTVLAPLFGALVSIAAALGGTIKFMAWWQDRQYKNKTESAKALTELPKHVPLNQKLHDFGIAEQRRVHFYQLTV